MENIEAMLCAFIEGDLDAAGKAQIEKHLQDNPQHKRLLHELTAMRDLVRNLPRVRAPIDVGDSLRQKVERSMLLDDGPAMVAERRPVNRLPQFFGIAAIVMLFASLCFIVFKALSPTLKPAVITQNLAMNPPTDQTAPIPSHEMITAAAPPNAMAEAESPQQSAAKQMLVAAPSAPAMPAQSTLQQQKLFAAVPIDFTSIRQRLADFGYDVQPLVSPTGMGELAPAASPPILMVVNTSDPLATKLQIRQFLVNSAGVSWDVVPADAQVPAKPATQPSFALGATSAQPESLLRRSQPLSAAGATTQPSATADLYVAHGLDAEKADALRQTLIGPENENASQVQVTMQSAVALVTTRPSEVLSDQIGQPDNVAAAPPATQPVDAANSAVALPRGAAMTPMALAQSSPTNSSPSVPVVHEVDTVIVLNATTMVPQDLLSPHTSSTLTPSTQPTLQNIPMESAPPTTQPAPTTQPQ
jgi:hypothetical protein